MNCPKEKTLLTAAICNHTITDPKNQYFQNNLQFRILFNYIDYYLFTHAFTFNPEILKIPAFMTKFIDLNNLSSFKKFLLILKGKLTSYVFNNLSNKNISRFY